MTDKDCIDLDNYLVSIKKPVKKTIKQNDSKNSDI